MEVRKGKQEGVEGGAGEGEKEGGKSKASLANLTGILPGKSGFSLLVSPSTSLLLPASTKPHLSVHTLDTPAVFTQVGELAHFT